VARRARELAWVEIKMNEFDSTDPTASSTRTDQAKQLIGQAGQTLKQEAQTFAAAAGDKVKAEAQKHAQTATKTLGDFANAVRRAGDELAQNDQSPASRLVRQAADGLEGLSRNLADKQPEDLLNAVRDFGRRNPAAFIGGAVLVGLALGRFVRASEPATKYDGFGGQNLALDDDAFDGPAEYAGVGMAYGATGLAEPLADSLDDLDSSPAPTVADEGIGEPDAFGSDGRGR
jgi:hypothetical protein